jgi:hypothetical protein
VNSISTVGNDAWEVDLVAPGGTPTSTAYGIFAKAISAKGSS